MFDYKQRILQQLLLVGDELALNGISGVNERFPWLAGNYSCNTGRGMLPGPDEGQSQLFVVSKGGPVYDFPVQWSRLRSAIRYSQENYGKYSDWWVVNRSSQNLHPFVLTGLLWIYLSDEQLKDDFGIVDLIHEPLHDWNQYGFGHGGDFSQNWRMIGNPKWWFGKSDLNDIVPTIIPSKQLGGSDFERFYNFLIYTTDTNTGKSLWRRIHDCVGDKPQRPTK
ncbi:MAG: hypothetical protein R3E01_36585 [Pirellulaceae bacterium]